MKSIMVFLVCVLLLGHPFNTNAQDWVANEIATVLNTTDFMENEVLVNENHIIFAGLKSHDFGQAFIDGVPYQYILQDNEPNMGSNCYHIDLYGDIVAFAGRVNIGEGSDVQLRVVIMHVITKEVIGIYTFRNMSPWANIKDIKLKGSVLYVALSGAGTNSWMETEYSGLGAPIPESNRFIGSGACVLKIDMATNFMVNQFISTGTILPNSLLIGGDNNIYFHLKDGEEFVIKKLSSDLIFRRNYYFTVDGMSPLVGQPLAWGTSKGVNYISFTNGRIPVMIDVETGEEKEVLAQPADGDRSFNKRQDHTNGEIIANHFTGDSFIQIRRNQTKSSGWYTRLGIESGFRNVYMRTRVFPRSDIKLGLPAGEFIVGSFYKDGKITSIGIIRGYDPAYINGVQITDGTQPYKSVTYYKTVVDVSNPNGPSGHGLTYQSDNSEIEYGTDGFVNFSKVKDLENVHVRRVFKARTVYMTGVENEFADLTQPQITMTIDSPNADTYASVIMAYRESATTGTLGVTDNDLLENSIVMYPTAGTENFLYFKDEKYFNKSVEIYTILGQKVISKKVENNKVDVSTLKPGIYICRIADDGKLITSKKFFRK